MSVHDDQDIMAVSKKVKILYPTFCLMVAGGCWRPTKWTSLPKTLIYNFYTVLVFFLLYAFAITQFLDILLNVRSADEFTENIYVLLASLMGCFKMLTLTINRENIKIVMNQLDQSPYKPRNEEEMQIRKNFDSNIGRKITHYAVMVEITLVSMLLSCYFTNYRSGKLAYRAWLPFNYSSSKLFLLCYIHQNVGLLFASILNLACDSILCGLLTHTCSQIDILKFRLSNITPETVKDLDNCVEYHNDLYRYARFINKKFHLIIAIQFITSTLVVCFTLYQLTNTPLGSKYLTFILYTFCMMLQIFIYCWYGNQLKLKSNEISDAVFEMDWPRLDNSKRRNLLMIMGRAKTPIEFTSVFVVVMDVNTFVGILKLSYSTYNLLQSSKDVR